MDERWTWAANEAFDPLVSVILLMDESNRRYIKESIESVLKQTYANLELIIVDDGSADAREALKPFTRYITAVKSGETGGMAAGKNAAISVSGGDLIAFLKCGDVWLPEKTSRSVERLLANPKAGLIATNALIQGEGGEGVPLWSRVVRRGSRLAERLLGGNFIAFSSVLVSVRALDKVGYYSEELESANDYDLWYRISCRFDVELVEQALAVLRHCDMETRDGLIGFYEDVLRRQERSVDRSIAQRRLAELLFAAGVEEVSAGNISAAKAVFDRLRRSGAPSLKMAAALLLESISPNLIKPFGWLAETNDERCELELELIV